MQKPISVSTRLTVILILPLCLLLFSSVTYGQPLARITVEAGDYARTDTPVAASLEGVPLGFPQDEIHLVEVKGSQRIDVPVQFEAGSPPRLWWVLSGTTQAGGKRTYELMEGAGPAASGVKTALTEKVLQVETNGTKVLSYNHAVVPAPVGQSPLFNRGAFIHPLWSPSGSVMTNIQPKDHYHHVGIWMPWTQTEFEGKPVDFWNLGEGQGTVRFKKFLSTTSGPVYGGFQAEQEHVALKTDKGEKVVLDEVWDVRVYNVGGPEKGYWLWDFVSTQRCVADSPLKLLEYRYGGFGFRGAAEWDGENAAYLTSEGKTRKDGHGTRARWCDTAGVSDGQWKGVTHFSHPQNFRHPEPMRIWPSGQVFFNWAPVQAGGFEMKPGEDHLFRYRLYVHEGKVDVERTEQVWNDYAHPPKTAVEVVRPGDAVVLFDGKDFSQWAVDGAKDIGWQIADGAMKSVPKTGSIVTKRSFGDFKMHAEFKTPQLPVDVKGQGRGNSGIYIQRRYELQILDSYGLEPKDNECASLYKFRAPDKNVCDLPGRWQSYDIIFHAARYEAGKKIRNARITVWHNGVCVHNDVELQDKTGAGRPEGPEPGPILLQEHGNEVWFRNVWIVPL